MKKINIVTFHRAHNYGAMLQAYALQEKLSKENEVEIIDYRDKKIEEQYKIFNVKFYNIKSFLKSLISSIIFVVRNCKRYYNFNKFLKTKLKLTRNYKTEKELKNNYPKSDVYITGSDQVWNSTITCGLKDAYTLNFGNKNTKRISYAASIGNSFIKEEEQEEYKNKITKLDTVSVREEKAKEILEKIVNKDIFVVLDPVFLMKKEDWENKLLQNKKINEKYIFAYVLNKDKEYFKIVNEISKITGLKVIHFGKRKEAYRGNIKSAYTSGPIEFLSLLKNAEYIVTTSFHATAFSVIFNKKFWVVPPKKTGTRVTNLLNKLNLLDRAVSNLEEFNSKDYNNDIDYKEVNSILDKEIKKSEKYLEDAIKI